jgi:hypothetical protein
LESWLSQHSLDETNTVVRRTKDVEPLTAARFAELIKVSRVDVWRWMTGKRCPSIDSAAAVELVTGIPAALWASDASLRPLSAAPKRARIRGPRTAA